MSGRVAAVTPVGVLILARKILPWPALLAPIISIVRDPHEYYIGKQTYLVHSFRAVAGSNPTSRCFSSRKGIMAGSVKVLVINSVYSDRGHGIMNIKNAVLVLFIQIFHHEPRLE
jgi:hypothetical protein